MRAYAQKTFELNATDKDGFTARTVIEGLVARTRDPVRRAEYQARLACPPFPEALGHVWNAFCRLSARRGSNGFAISPIGWPDIDAFTRHSGARLAPWEIRLVEQLDDLFLRAQNMKPRD